MKNSEATYIKVPFQNYDINNWPDLSRFFDLINLHLDFCPIFFRHFGEFNLLTCIAIYFINLRYALGIPRRSKKRMIGALGNPTVGIPRRA